MSRGRIMGYLVELDLLDPEDVPITLFFSDVPVRPWPSDDPDRPDQAYDPRIVEVPAIALDVHADATRLTGSLGTARLALGNADGALNQYRGHVFRAVRVWWGEVKHRGARGFAADFRQMLDGRAEAPLWAVSSSQPSRLVVPIYDRRLDLEPDIQDNDFAGTNVGATGYEGGPDDLKGQPKPLALGDLQTAYIPVVWVNPAAQVAQAHDGEMQAYTALFDRGDDANLTEDGDLSGAAFDAATPSVGHQVTDLDRGLIKVNQSFGGVVTVGVQGAVDLAPGAGYLDTAPDLVAALIKRQDPAATIGASFASIDAPAKVGIYLADRTATRQAIDMLARSLPGWVLPSPTGIWNIGRLRLPAGEPLRTIRPVDIVSIAPGDAEVSRPAWKVTVKGARKYLTHNRSNLAGGLWDTETEEQLRQEWSRASAFDTDLRDRWWPNVREVEIETALRNPVDLQDVADLLFSLMSVRADGTPFQEWVVVVELDEEWLDLLADPGLGEADVGLDYPPEAIDRTMLIMGARPSRPRGNLLTLRLWG